MCRTQQATGGQAETLEKERARAGERAGEVEVESDSQSPQPVRPVAPGVDSFKLQQTLLQRLIKPHILAKPTHNGEFFLLAF